ncbi:hypothetical protein ESCO_002684 [Escovopsis weberi]|uniref:Uncharacterized protein n=1 Tax=Escovopsis weberi TaxID=150374 RepID=A0A0M8MVI7_ESCWE|nr:hypothetical protein ESCO_002684 [Escovopsis weberi]
MSVRAMSVKGQAGWTPPMVADPARFEKREERGNTRMELPPDAYLSETGKDLFALRGNKFNTEGRPEMVEVNQLRMTKFSFDISVP